MLFNENITVFEELGARAYKQKLLRLSNPLEANQEEVIGLINLKFIMMRKLLETINNLKTSKVIGKEKLWMVELKSNDKEVQELIITLEFFKKYGSREETKMITKLVSKRLNLKKDYTLNQLINMLTFNLL